MDNTQNTKKYARLTFDERCQIAQMLREGNSLLRIARTLHRHPSSIRREIKTYAVPSDKGASRSWGGKNRCQKKADCQKQQTICDDCPRKGTTWHCKNCRKCNGVCPDFVEETCTKLKQPPFVCNGCPKEARCALSKMYYLAKPAHDKACETRRETRKNIYASEEELLRMSRLLGPLVKMRQSINHILSTHADELTMSIKTIYRYIDAGLISIRNGDLPRKVYLKPRKRKPTLVYKADKKCRIGRTREDYFHHCEAEGPFPRVLMDTVIGKPGGKVILTIHFCESNFMLARLLPNKTSQSVIDAFNELSALLGYTNFRDLFPVILTDNGTEFSNPTRLEHFPEGDLRTRIFYCDTYNSNQKAEIERNHEFLRLILPKGQSFDDLTQEDLDRILSHINSYTRPKLGNKTPIDLFAHRYSAEILDRVNQTPIAPDQICLTETLIKRS